MKFLATIILFILSSLWYYIWYNYLIELVPNTILNNYNNYSILILLAWMFVFWVLFWKTLSNKEVKKINKKELSQELLETFENKNYSEEIFILEDEKENIKKTYYNYENDYEPTKNSIDIILDEKKEISKHNINLKKQTSKNKIIEKKETFIKKSNNIITQENTIDKTFLNVANNLKKNNKQDLKIIEWIWPKIEELLNKWWIYSYKDLANSEIVKLQKILATAGKRYIMLHNPITWSKQASIANSWNFKQLKEYQDRLVKWVEK